MAGFVPCLGRDQYHAENWPTQRSRDGTVRVFVRNKSREESRRETY